MCQNYQNKLRCIVSSYFIFTLIRKNAVQVQILSLFTNPMITGVRVGSVNTFKSKINYLAETICIFQLVGGSEYGI